MRVPYEIMLEDSFFYYDQESVTNKYASNMKKGHHHNFFEVYYLCSGECTVFIGDKTYSVHPNSLIFIPPDTIHQYTYITNKHQRILLSFTTDYINPNIVDIISPLWEQHVCKLPSTDSIDKLLQKISSHAYSDDVFSKELIRCYLVELFHYAHSVLNAGFASTDLLYIPPIHNILDYISQNFAQDITLHQLAVSAGYSDSYFSRLFKTVTGMGYKEYTLLIRLKHAENLLSSTNKSIKNIAIDSGFNDTNRFSLLFKQKYGLSPSEFRKKLSESKE